MEHEENPEGAARAGVPTYLVEAVAAAILLIIGLAVVFESRKLGAGWTTDGPGAGYFPFYIGVLIVVSGAGILYQALLGKNRNTTPFVDSEQFRRVLSVLLPATGYVLAITFLGLYVASAIYIALFMVVLGKYSWLKSVLIGFCVNALFFCMFEVWFKVPLFKGSLDPLRFLGY
ncbi:tripartite tricarboxylate transporter TctB family protein [Variovorax sp. KK3]|uniref:tripartite tricarboxylate transporter TctB family protein n=1 Tax=Variovorax sp. KK3 TaxID=1855728 RepID=UPI00097C66C3|nr:tripartite tricarboxylate transporter TctB family protein [Variovorax sp. KK3]